MKQRGGGRALAFALGVLTAATSPASAEQELGPVVVSGEAQLGGRGSWGDDDSAKFEEYRDIGKPAFGSLRFLIEDTEQRYFLQGWLDDMGEDDQQYRFKGGRYGRWGIRGFYSEIPHVFSNQAVSPWVGQGDGVLELPDPPDFLRTLAPCDPTIGCAYNDQLTPSTAAVPSPTLATPLRFRTIEGSGEIFFKPTSAWDLSAGYRVWDRDGSRAKGLGFGGGGGGTSTYINVAAPIQERTHEARVDVQYVRDSWNLGLNYTGSFFENDLDGFEADNPRADTTNDSESFSALGRVSLAPDNSAHLVSLSGAGILPTSFPARLAASFSWGLSLQNDDFLPITSNEEITGNLANAPLLVPAAGSLDGRVQTINGNVVFTARPLDDLNLKVRYRVYDHNNFTDPLTWAGQAPNDRNIRAGDTSIHYRYRRHNALAEAAWRVAAPVTTTFGFVWENWDRDREREVRNNNEYGPTARVDWRAAAWARLRASYAFTVRRGSDYDELGNLEGLRKYPQAERLHHRFNLQTQLDPWDVFGVTLTSGFDLSNFDDSDRGLTDDNRFNIGVDATYRPHQRVGLWANYAYDYIWAFQRQFDSTPGDWSSTTRDTAHNGGVGADFVLIPDLLDGELSYFIQLARARTEGGGVPDFPIIKDTLQAVTAGLSVHPLEYLSFRGIYRWEKYDRKNFHEDFPRYTNTTGDVYLQNRIADYNAHIFSFSAIVSF